MKLVMAIINDEDAYKTMDTLGSEGFMVTKLATTGGFLRSGNTTLICGISDDRLDEFIHIIESKCRSRKQIAAVSTPPIYDSTVPPFPVEVTVGGATIFVMDVTDFRKV